MKGLCMDTGRRHMEGESWGEWISTCSVLRHFHTDFHGETGTINKERKRHITGNGERAFAGREGRGWRRVERETDSLLPEQLSVVNYVLLIMCC